MGLVRINFEKNANNYCGALGALTYRTARKINKYVLTKYINLYKRQFGLAVLYELIFYGISSRRCPRTCLST